MATSQLPKCHSLTQVATYRTATGSLPRRGGGLGRGGSWRRKGRPSASFPLTPTLSHQGRGGLLLRIGVESSPFRARLRLRLLLQTRRAPIRRNLGFLKIGPAMPSSRHSGEGGNPLIPEKPRITPGARPEPAELVEARRGRLFAGQMTDRQFEPICACRVRSPWPLLPSACLDVIFVQEFRLRRLAGNAARQPMRHTKRITHG